MKELEGIGQLKKYIRRCLSHNQDIGSREVEYPNGIKIIDQYTTEYVWFVYNSSVTGEFGYEGTFEEVLGGKKITKIVKEIKDRKGEVVAMDLMGSGLQGLDIDHLLAVRLGVNENFAYEGEIIQGDILRRSTWNEIRTFLERRGKRSFDLVVCRPCGGLDIIPYNLGVFNSLAGRVWNLLSSDNGIILSQLPQYYFSYEPEMRKDLSLVDVHLRGRGIFIQRVDRSNKETDVTKFYPTIMMMKTPGSPEKFPEIDLHALALMSE